MVPIDATPPPTTHLLITEVALAPTTEEFIEIFNPGPDAVDLSDYYLSDNNIYSRLPEAPSLVTGDDIADFVARFPAGASIGPGEVRVIALQFNDFTLGQKDFGISDTAGAQTSQIMRDPTLDAVAQGPLIGSAPTMTTDGEGVVLFLWDGASDLVEDVDMVLAGNPTVGNSFQPKTNLTVDGPDTGAGRSGYRADAMTMANIGPGAPSGKTHNRIALEDGNETHNGLGNGIIGHDETSENLGQTWDVDPYADPSPGLVPAALTE